ncbi:glycine zipper 2TM domain-containing protein [Acetobacteraceae bacterium H6797]|nr:glycine zipper 2TM domain-containing protein [Acetobacteraceae bacterium H6797]
MRPVTVQGSPGGVGTVAGAAAGGIAGSFIGGDPRSNLLGALGGAIIGGVAGNAIERGATTGQAIEFTIRTAQGDIALVQSNEENLQVGEQVRILRGERTRISRDVAVPPPGAYPPPSTTYQTPGYPPPGYQPPAYPPQPAYPDPNYPPPRY